MASDGKDDGKVYHADETGDVTFGAGLLKETQFTEWKYEIKDPNLAEFMPTLLKHEGGLINHSKDPGGLTNMGITLSTFKKYAQEDLGVKPTAFNLSRLTTSQASAIYEKRYWEESGASRIIDKQVAWLYMDTRVNGGLQRVLEKTTGHLNQPNSVTGLNNIISKYGGSNAHYAFKTERNCRYDWLINRNSRLSVFENGWKARVGTFKYK
jgi:lysozyme family protein